MTEIHFPIIREVGTCPHCNMSPPHSLAPSLKGQSSLLCVEETLNTLLGSLLKFLVHHLDGCKLSIRG